MEALAMDKLIEKGGATPQLAQAIGEALDITLKATNLVTVPVLDTRFAQLETKLEVRFGAVDARFNTLERDIARTKVWAVLLYAGLLLVFFGALAADRRYLDARSDARLAAEDARTDRLIADDLARTDRMIAEDQTRADQANARMDTKFEQLRALILSHSQKP